MSCIYLWQVSDSRLHIFTDDFFSRTSWNTATYFDAGSYKTEGSFRISLVACRLLGAKILPTNQTHSFPFPLPSRIMPPDWSWLLFIDHFNRLQSAGRYSWFTITPATLTVGLCFLITIFPIACWFTSRWGRGVDFPFTLSTSYLVMDGKTNISGPTLLRNENLLTKITVYYKFYWIETQKTKYKSEISPELIEC